MILPPGLPSELTTLAHSLAYESAVSVIDGESLHTEEEDWREVDAEGEVDLFDALRYLELRGLLVRHETRPWIQILDEAQGVR